ncbi:MAG: amidohydrolase family protein [Pirellulales bacterium]|nr:amidohydrolase family protein [Pirellulales bacterium]
MIVDGHVHFYSVKHYCRLMSDMRRTEARQFCVLVLDQVDPNPDTFALAEGIWLKLHHPNEAFVFGGLDYTGLMGGGQAPLVPLVEQLNLLRAMGLDGFKSYSGKPNVRQKIGHALDSPVFTPMMNWLEATRFPLLWHVNDPPEFWDKNTVPIWAKEKGWWYEADTPSHAQIDREIRAVFARHPNLNLILPHFFFLSDRLDEAAKLLETYPGFCLDLAPGVEMLHNFTKNWPAARDFFIAFADRIIFGTDIGLCDHCSSPDRGVMVRKFLETDDVFPVPDDPAMTPDERPDLHGLGLPPTVTKQIFSENFYRIVGRRGPRPIQEDLARRTLQSLAEQARSDDRRQMLQS